MIRVLLAETLKTAFLLLVVSVVGFVALDATGEHDWWWMSEHAMRAGLPAARAMARDLPTLWNARVADAHVRTLDDLRAAQHAVLRDEATARLVHRGTAALPTLLERLQSLPPAQRDAALDVLRALAPRITGGETAPPSDPSAALDYWDRFYALRGLDFRGANARRLVQRLVDRDSRNAEEQLLRLGTFVLPAVFDVLEQPLDTASARRLTSLLSDLTGLSLRIDDRATASDMQTVVETWLAWWFVERLEYETLSDVGRFVGHVTETRYGRWLVRALTGRLGRSTTTGRPFQAELRERIPRSVFIGGLGALLAVAFVVAFGGGPVLRKRRIGIKLLDLVGALIPGLGALTVGMVVLIQVLAAPSPGGPLARRVFDDPTPLVLGVLVLAPLTVLFLRRQAARLTLHAVRKEAESWALESRHPHPMQVVRHGARVGAASLLAPLSLAALPLVGLTLAVEPLMSVKGMGDLTLRSIRPLDPPWLLLALVSLVPLYLGQHWARRLLVIAVGGTKRIPQTADGTGELAIGPATDEVPDRPTGATEDTQPSQHFQP